MQEVGAWKPLCRGGKSGSIGPSRSGFESQTWCLGERKCEVGCENLGQVTELCGSVSSSG